MPVAESFNSQMKLGTVHVNMCVYYCRVLKSKHWNRTILVAGLASFRQPDFLTPLTFYVTPQQSINRLASRVAATAKSKTAMDIYALILGYCLHALLLQHLRANMSAVLMVVHATSWYCNRLTATLRDLYLAMKFKILSFFSFISITASNLSEIQYVCRSHRQHGLESQLTNNLGW